VLLLPRRYDGTVLQLVYTHLLGAHLEMKKTRERIAARFHWPVMRWAMEDYCRSCLECQITAPNAPFRELLVPLPIIGVPFECIAMARGHRYILVIVDYATRYPEAHSPMGSSLQGNRPETIPPLQPAGHPEQDPCPD
jgi:hypothetical protein